ncbi:hypothetical protein O181_125929 [Austropuccinia psidii MF-1]|uniref:Uncharacterized protein n=1 Tax=Austropuccinia psidii MF-1 TaxID=1389203 RepID=A0A9Q3KSE1_9BASI|nr:hypothetical protein [Austropuccinia psidii MF-1]
MVTLSGPNYMIPNKVPNPSPILKEDLSAMQSGNSLAATRRPFKDPNHLALQDIPQTTQLVHTGSNQASCMTLAQLSQFMFHCGNSVTQFNAQDRKNCIGPIQTIQPDHSPSRISLSAFHIYWPPFITWGPFFPVN